MWYDVLVVGVLLYAVVRGASKGIVWQLATIAALVLCFAFSESLSLAIAPYITLNPPLNRWVAMFGIYIFFSFVSFGVARWLKSWIDKAQFVEYDRHLGSVFGFVKGVLFVLVMTFFGVTLTQQTPDLRAAIFNSKTGQVAAVVMDRLHPVLPDELHDVLEPYIHSLDRPGLDLHAHHGHEDQDDHGHAHDHGDEGKELEPIEAPPFPLSPRRNDPQPPPYDELSGRPLDSQVRDFFDTPITVPTVPDAPTRNPYRDPVDNRLDTSNLRAERETLLREMAGVLAEQPAAQQAIMDQIENSLNGLPDQIKFRVVKDWYTDVMIFDPNADPDRDTDISTPFDARILRQLQLNNVPLSSLSTALQERLRNTRRN